MATPGQLWPKKYVTDVTDVTQIGRWPKKWARG
nr:MAG TPA: hypothetical protein [Caudoviricetes sp.]